MIEPLRLPRSHPSRVAEGWGRCALCQHLVRLPENTASPVLMCSACQFEVRRRVGDG